MLHFNIFLNPRVTLDMYVHVKVVDIDVKEYREGHRIYIHLRVPPDQEHLSDQDLFAVIHPTPQAAYPLEKFRRAFGIHGTDYRAAQGKWAAVRVVPAEYHGTRFSNVHFVTQTAMSQQKSRMFAALEADGEITM